MPRFIPDEGAAEAAKRHAEAAAVSAINHAMSAEDWPATLAPEVAEHLAPVHAAGMDAGLEYVRDQLAAPSPLPVPPAAPPGLTPGPGGAGETGRLGVSLDQIDRRAVAWARQHAAELVRQVSDNTRGLIRAEVVRAHLEGVNGAAELAERLRDSIGFNEARAMRIARTEPVNASAAGALDGFHASGVVWGKRWLVGFGACPVCLANAAAGPIALAATFPSGDQRPTAHPHCRCALAPVINPPAGHNLLPALLH